MLVLFKQVGQAVGREFMPHYKEDAFRELVTSEALKMGWGVYEGRQVSGPTVPAGQTGVYFLSWAAGRLARKNIFIRETQGGKADVRLLHPSKSILDGEVKSGFTGSASEGNSNHTKVAADIDLVASGSREFFLGLFDADMTDRLQGRRSSAGRGAQMASLLSNAFLGAIPAGKTGHAVPTHPTTVDKVYQWGSSSLTTTMTALACGCGDSLLLFVTRRTASGW